MSTLLPPRVRRPLAAALLPILLAPAWLASQEAGPEGRWEGEIRLPGSPLGVVVDLVSADGGWEGEIDIPAQGLADRSLSAVSVRADSVSFAISGIPGEPTFRGALAAGGDSLAGEFAQGGATFPFALARTGEPEVAGGRPSVQEALEGWDEFVLTSMEEWNVPGVAMAIVQDGEVVLAEGYGLRDVESGLQVTPETVFPIGSSSKAFTGLVLALLVEDGELAWDEPVTTWLPDFELEEEFAGERMNPEDLLTHRSGLPRHDLIWYGSPFDRASLVQRVRHLEPSAPFRTRFQYQNLMYATAGWLAGQVTGSTWEEQVRARIFEPLGMGASTFSVDTMVALTDDYALGYRPLEEDAAEEAADPVTPEATPGVSGQEAPGEGVARMDFRNIDAIGPAGSINSNVLDMARWVEAQLGQGTVDGEEALPAAAVARTHQPRVVVDEGIFSVLLQQPEFPYLMYGLGWFIQPYRGHRMIHHGGNIDGFSALVSFLPDDGTGLVILTNMNGTSLPNVLALSAYDRLMGLEPADWNARYRGIQDRIEAAQEGAEEAGRDAVEGTSPSHELDAYAAAYTNPGYGRLEVEGTEDGLVARYNAFTMPLEHVHYDVFEGRGEPPYDDLRFRFQFQSNLRGRIDRVSVPLQAGVDPILFRRLPPDSLSEPAYLRRFEGDYDVMGATARVRLRDGALTLTLPGQPAYTLVPSREDEFALEDREGYAVRFEREDGTVTAMILVQPGGTLRAERRP